LRDGGVALDHAALNVHGAANGIDHAGKFNQHAVAGGFDNAAAVFSDTGIDQLAAVRLERGMGPHLIGAHQAAVTNHIGGQNCCEPALHGISRQFVFNGTSLPAINRGDKYEEAGKPAR
jgi:hypothetical protein